MATAIDIDALAAIWVQRWLAYGGGVIVDLSAATASISMSLDGRRWRRPAHGKGPKVPDQRLWHDGWVVGRWRELQELCFLIPGLNEAIVDYVAEHGHKGGGRAWMVEPHPWSKAA